MIARTEPIGALVVHGMHARDRTRQEAVAEGKVGIAEGRQAYCQAGALFGDMDEGFIMFDALLNHVEQHCSQNRERGRSYEAARCAYASQSRRWHAAVRAAQPVRVPPQLGSETRGSQTAWQ